MERRGSYRRAVPNSDQNQHRIAWHRDVQECQPSESGRAAVPGNLRTCKTAEFVWRLFVSIYGTRVESWRSSSEVFGKM